ncbi:hypothetical protein ACSBR1_029011 [Camellia fascicularis]
MCDAKEGVLGVDLRNWCPNRKYWGWRRSKGGGMLWSKLPIYLDGLTPVIQLLGI